MHTRIQLDGNEDIAVLKDSNGTWLIVITKKECEDSIVIEMTEQQFAELKNK